VLQNSEAGEHIEETDLPLLEKLKDIRGRYEDGRNKLVVEFEFEDN
jgi:hypothetical protein